MSIALLVSQRVKYEKEIAENIESAITSGLNRMEVHRKISATRSDNTADLHALHINVLYNALGIPCNFGPTSENDLKEHWAGLKDRLSEAEYPAPKEDHLFISAVEKLSEKRKTLGAWASFLWKLETAFLIFGTLQWGYGDRWVIQINNLFLQ